AVVCAPATKILDWIGPIPWTFFIFVELPILPWAVLAYQCGSSMFLQAQFTQMRLVVRVAQDSLDLL
ncbi:hypothetical protein ACJX0J_024907, partial [Zea mays]